MAIEPFLRIQDRLTNKNFIDAEQWDFEFNKFTDYINTKLLPALNQLFDIQILASQLPDDVDGYLYENEVGNLVWKKPDNAGLLLNFLEPFASEIGFVGQKIGDNFLSFLKVDYVEDGVVFCKNNNAFEIRKITNNNIENNIFDNSNFATNSITVDKLQQYNYLYTLNVGANTQFIDLDRLINFRIAENYLTFNCIKSGELKSSNKNANFDYQAKNIYIRSLPENMFGVGSKWQLNEYKCVVNTNNYLYIGNQIDLRPAPFTTIMPLVNIGQALYDETDYARNAMFKDNCIEPLFLRLKPWLSGNLGDYYKMNIPSRCFADKSVGVQGSHYDYICFWGGDIKYVGCLPEKNDYNENVAPQYNIDNLFSLEALTFDFVEDDIIDIDFFPKRIQDKINARV